MHVFQREDVKSPIESTREAAGHHEIIYEMLGRATGVTSNRHSVAYIVIPPGKSSRPHYHPEVEESYYILKGSAKMMLAEEERAVGPGQIVLIPSPLAHQIINEGQEDLEFLAICVPAWEATNSVYLDDWPTAGPA